MTTGNKNKHTLSFFSFSSRSNNTCLSSPFIIINAFYQYTSWVCHNTLIESMQYIHSITSTSTQLLTADSTIMKDTTKEKKVAECDCISWWCIILCLTFGVTYSKIIDWYMYCFYYYFAVATICYKSCDNSIQLLQ